MQLLKEQGKTAKELANYLGIDASSVSGWAKGSYPSSKHIIGISHFFDVSIEYLFTGTQQDGQQRIGLSDDAIEVAYLWDALDILGKNITRGEISRRYEESQQTEVREESHDKLA